MRMPQNPTADTVSRTEQRSASQLCPQDCHDGVYTLNLQRSSHRQRHATASHFSIHEARHKVPGKPKSPRHIIKSSWRNFTPLQKLPSSPAYEFCDLTNDSFAIARPLPCILCLRLSGRMPPDARDSSGTKRRDVGGVEQMQEQQGSSAFDVGLQLREAKVASQRRHLPCYAILLFVSLSLRLWRYRSVALLDGTKASRRAGPTKSVVLPVSSMRYQYH